MEDLLAKRIRRLHGDFIDPDGEYDIVSSLSTGSRSVNNFEGSDKSVVLHHNDIAASDVEYVKVVPASVVAIGDSSESLGALFYLQVFWIMLTVCGFIYFSWGWMVASWSTKYIFPSWEAEPERNGTVEEITRTTTKTTTTSLTYTKHSVASNRCPNEVRNLGLQFEQMKQFDGVDAGLSISKTATSIRNVPQSTCDATTETVELDATTQMVESGEQFFVDALHHFSPQEGIRHRKPSPVEMSSSPPDLVEEPSPATLMPLLSRRCNTTPTRSQAVVPKMKRASSASSLPTPSPDPISPAAVQHSVSAPLDFEIDANSSKMDHSFIEQTPQKLAQEFCQNLQIIEEVLAKSGTRIDPSRAADLAMIHQTTQIKQQQQYHEQQRYEYHARLQSSSISTDRYDQYLQQLSKLRDDCLQSVTDAINYSALVCLLLEGARHAASLMESLEYFSVDHFGEVLLQMACGCSEETRDEVFGASHALQSQPSSYISIISSVFLSTISQSIGNTTNNSLTVFLRFAGYISCAMCYMLLCAAMMVVHSILGELHCPALVHQLLNVAMVTLYLAQNPSAWAIVTRNLEVYWVWFLLQVAISVVSFAMVLALYIRYRNQLLLQQQSENQGKQQTTNRQNVGRMLAQLEDLRWVLSIVPPFLMGGLVLATAGNRS